MKHPKLDQTIRLLKRGWQTAMTCASDGGCWSLSQRVGDLKRNGVEVADKWVELPSGAKVKAYRIVRATRWSA